MPEWKNQPGVLPSLIDRLTDSEPGNRHEAPPPPAQAMRAFKRNLRRDVEWLLNSRRQIAPLPEWGHELRYSLFQYGLPDLTTMALNTAQDQNRLVRLIEDTIETFEPRLQNVTVSLLPVSPSARVLKFHIDALLRVDPGPERIQFDTTLELASGSYTVEGDAGAR